MRGRKPKSDFIDEKITIRIKYEEKIELIKLANEKSTTISNIVRETIKKALKGGQK